MSITVNNPSDTTPPAVALTAPLNGATVAKGSTITVTANASDNVGVSRVEFYVSGALKATDSASPYSFSWKVPNKPGATYQLQAKAYDASGNVGRSMLVSVKSR